MVIKPQLVIMIIINITEYILCRQEARHATYTLHVILPCMESSIVFPLSEKEPQALKGEATFRKSLVKGWQGVPTN